MSKLTELFIVGCTIVDEPGTYKVKVMSNTSMTTVGKDNPRYLVNLRACKTKDINYLANRLFTEGEVEFSDIDVKFFVGALWLDQIDRTSDLPIKGEDVLATFDYVEDEIMCTRIEPVYRKEYELLNTDAIRKMHRVSKLFL